MYQSFAEKRSIVYCQYVTYKAQLTQSFSNQAVFCWPFSQIHVNNLKMGKICSGETPDHDNLYCYDWIFPCNIFQLFNKCL